MPEQQPRSEAGGFEPDCPCTFDLLPSCTDLEGPNTTVCICHALVGYVPS